VCLCIAFRFGSGVVAWAPAWCGAVRGSRTRLGCVGGLPGCGAGRGATVAGVLARQVPGLELQQDQRQVPQRGVGTVVADVSVCAVGVHAPRFSIMCVARATARACVLGGKLGVARMGWCDGPRVYGRAADPCVLCIALRCGSGVVAWAPAWYGVVRGSRTRLGCVGGLPGCGDGRGAIVAGVLARQRAVLAQQPDRRQLPQRCVRTVVADVSVCVCAVGVHAPRFSIMRVACASARACALGGKLGVARMGWCDGPRV
jgi:hypothetical protein